MPHMILAKFKDIRFHKKERVIFLIKVIIYQTYKKVIKLLINKPFINGLVNKRIIFVSYTTKVINENVVLIFIYFEYYHFCLPPV